MVGACARGVRVACVWAWCGRLNDEVKILRLQEEEDAVGRGLRGGGAPLRREHRQFAKVRPGREGAVDEGFESF